MVNYSPLLVEADHRRSQPTGDKLGRIPAGTTQSSITHKIGESSARLAPSAAMHALILNELPFLRRVVRRWHGRASDADDLVQETLMRALANAHLWQPGSNLRAWLVTIMRNHFLATLARAGCAADAHQAFAEARERSVPNDSENRLTLRDVSRTLDRMPNAQRQALILVGLECKSYEDVAHILGISADAVRSHLARARRYLKSAVQGTDLVSPLASERMARRPSYSVK